MSDGFQNFIDSMDNVPPELERNFILMRDLDARSQDLKKQVDNCLVDYKKSKSKSGRAQILALTNELYSKLDSYAADKVSLANQIYDLIDRNIRRFESVSTSPEPEQKKPIELFDMPADENEPKFCFCRNISFGQMIACDNPECSIEWFHFQCVGLDVKPKGNWFCPNCKNLVKSRRSSRSRRRKK